MLVLHYAQRAIDPSRHEVQQVMLVAMQLFRQAHGGLLTNSILASRDFERAVDALEHITLGPFARHV